MRIGDLHPVSDGTFVARPTYLGSQMPADAHPELFDRHGTAWLPLGCFQIHSGERVVLVNAGLGPELQDGMHLLVGGQLLTGLRAQGEACGWAKQVFTETASGARTVRPTLTQLLDQLRPGDTLVVWKLDRLGRSLRHLVDTIIGLAEGGIGFRSLQEAIDTTTPGGKLVFHVFAALAEFERDLIRERTNAGLAAARARGRHGGRPPVMTAHKLQVAREMYASRQYTVATIAKTLGVSRASIYRHLTQMGS